MIGQYYFEFKLKIKLFLWIYNDVIKLFFFFGNYRWIQSVITLDLGLNIGNLKMCVCVCMYFFPWIDIVDRLLIDALRIIKFPNSRFCFNDESTKWHLNPQPFWPHSKALTTKPSIHMITRNDIVKDINTHFELKNACFLCHYLI